MSVYTHHELVTLPTQFDVRDILPSGLQITHIPDVVPEEQHTDTPIINRGVFKALKRTIVDGYVAVRLNSENLPYRAELLDEPGIVEARQWVAQTYVDKGMIKSADLREDGTLNDEADPYFGHSIYYGVRKKSGELLMAARLILPKDGDIYSLQMHTEDLHPETQETLDSLGPRIGEFASFIKRPRLGAIDSRFASLFLIRNILQDSVKRGIDNWVFTMNPGVASSYQRVFGNSMTKIGENVRSGIFNIQGLTAFYVNATDRLRTLKAENFSTLAACALKKFMSKELSIRSEGEMDLEECDNKNITSIRN